ncbi:hypothetical protein LV85_01784 [Algoriphagus chordae]|uniref:Uncharacterized protein n=1 Tax=Algoriphagus chordae TaxID=237019 RepID=A0A2W7R2B9_9BACT|nr:hypothetical protein LV85_01784 [Algoriphagus chordae]
MQKQQPITQDHIFIKILNLTFSGFIILSNISVFFPYTFRILKSGGGPFGYGVLLLPITLIGILYLIPASLTLKRKNHYNTTFLWINLTGTIGCAYWIYFFNSSLFS